MAGSKSAKEKLLDSLSSPLVEVFEDQGITPKYLARKLKSELNAKETTVFKAIEHVIYSKPLVAWEVRQKARQDAHKLLGHYAPEKHEFMGRIDLGERLNRAIERRNKANTSKKKRTG